MTSADVVLVVLDDMERTRMLARGLIGNGVRVAITSDSVHQLVPLLGGVRPGLAYAVVADPSDPRQVERLLERVRGALGQVTVILDPGERLAGNHAMSHAA